MGQDVTASFTGKNAALSPKRTESGAVKEIFLENFGAGIGDCLAGRYADLSAAKAPDGTDALCVKIRDNTGTFNGSVFYLKLSTAVTIPNLLGTEPLSMQDVGRCFTVQVKLFDTTSRTVQLMLNGCTSGKENLLDYRRSIYDITTEAGAWTTFAFDYEVYEPLFGEIGRQTKTLTISVSPDGDRLSPLYIGEITVTEKL